jgi:hypothetical protein
MDQDLSGRTPAAIELVLVIPLADGTSDDFPLSTDVSWKGSPARSKGLSGAQEIQLAVVVTLGTLQTLRTWLRYRAERLKKTKVVWHGREFRGYTAAEVETLIKAIQAQLESRHD